MKIAHINPGVRGVATYALNLYNYFNTNEKENDNLVVSARKWNKQPIPVFEPKSVLIANILPWVLSPNQVYEHLKGYNPDILHNHHPSGTIEFSIGKLQKKLDIPLITTVHMSVGSKKYFVDRMMNTLFLTVRKNLKRSTCYVAISEFVRKQLLEIGGLPEEQIVLLYAGIDPEIYRPIEKNSSEALELTFCGQIMPEKGIDLLIDVVMDLNTERKVNLNIVGEGNLAKQLKYKTRNNKEINWIGFVDSPQKVAKWYSYADAVILPTRWDEAFSYIPLEAMGCGTPVIASKTGGNTEIVFEGKTGHHFELKNKNQLYDIIKKLDKKKCYDMGQLGREHILKKHTLNAFGEKYSSLYHNVLDNPTMLKPID